MSILGMRGNCCMLLPPIVRLVVLVAVMIFVIVLLNRDHSLTSATTAALTVGLAAARIARQVVVFPPRSPNGEACTW
jgi:uncharacterized membrane protein